MIRNFSKFNIIQMVVLFFALGTILLIPFKIISYGYIPSDDALRHAAKVISGKSWDQILVLRDDSQMDRHPGWHLLLTAIYKTTRCSIDGLVVFSVVFLFLLFAIPPLFFIKRPEVWLVTLLITAVTSPTLILRLFMGRPFIFTMSTLLFFGFFWQRFSLKRASLPVLCVMVLLIAISTWFHCVWYLFILPIISLFIAGKPREAIAFAVCVVVGVMLGLVASGHPIQLINQSINVVLRNFNDSELVRTISVELQPINADFHMALVIFGLILWSKITTSRTPETITNPVFIMATMGWILSYVATRFTLDWGFPVFGVWIAVELQHIFGKTIEIFSWRRVAAVFVLSCVLFLSLTADVGGRWTFNLNTPYLSAEDPKLNGWLPDPGGIIYTTDMLFFYQTFYKNPNAPWRYIIGFEPTEMPEDDFKILKKIQFNYGAFRSYQDWINKMRPEDRLVIISDSRYVPRLNDLEWLLAANNTWIGRLPSNPSS